MAEGDEQARQSRDAEQVAARIHRFAQRVIQVCRPTGIPPPHPPSDE